MDTVYPQGDEIVQNRVLVPGVYIVNPPNAQDIRL